MGKKYIYIPYFWLDGAFTHLFIVPFNYLFIVLSSNIAKDDCKYNSEKKCSKLYTVMSYNVTGIIKKNKAGESGMPGQSREGRWF